MTVKRSSKSSVLIPKGLTELHFESTQWLSAIESWKTEFRFFRKLIDKNFLRVTLTDKLRELETFDSKLEHINTHELAPLETEIIKHEYYLNKFESGDSDVDDVSYRKFHQTYSQNMQEFETAFRKFKLELYNCIEHISD